MCTMTSETLCFIWYSTQVFAKEQYQLSLNLPRHQTWENVAYLFYILVLDSLFHTVSPQGIPLLFPLFFLFITWWLSDLDQLLLLISWSCLNRSMESIQNYQPYHHLSLQDSSTTLHQSVINSSVRSWPREHLTVSSVQNKWWHK